MRQLDNSAALAEFDRAIARSGAVQVGLSVAVRPVGEEARIIAGAATALAPGQSVAKTSPLKYAGFDIVRSAMSVDNLRAALAGLAEGTPVRLGRLGRPQFKGWLQRVVEAGTLDNLGMLVGLTRPSTFFEINLDVPQDVQQALRDTRPVEGTGPLYPSAMTALFAEVFGRPIRSDMGMFNCVGHFHILVPHPGYYLRTVAVRDKELRFEIEKDESFTEAPKPVSVSLYLETDGAPVTTSVRLRGDVFSYEAPQPIRRAMFRMLARDGSVVDEYDASFRHHEPLNVLSAAAEWGEVGTADAAPQIPVPRPPTSRSRLVEPKGRRLTPSRSEVKRVDRSSSVSPGELSRLHPTIRERCGVAFATAQYSTAVFEALKAVEADLRVRSAAPSNVYGTGLASRALKPDDPQLVISDVSAEQEAAHQLFRGALGLFKNPLSHRYLDTLGPEEALEALALASLLLRLLDQSERRVVLAGRGQQGDDDHVIPGSKSAPLVIDFSQVRKAMFRIQPAPTTRDWRFGLKLRGSKTFDPNRFAAEQALLHIFRDRAEDRLRVMYCDQQAHDRLQVTGAFPGVELEGAGFYRDGDVLLAFERRVDGLHVSVGTTDDHTLELSTVLDTASNRYAQVWAWADAFAYQLTVGYRLIGGED